MLINNDTIIAPITPSGIGAIAVFRLSGSNSFQITDKIFRAYNLQKIINQNSHTITIGNIFDGKDILDQVLIFIFKSPKSYTGENVIEISCHGSLYIQQKIIELFIKHGARLAQPGEFTLRSFMNGKIDLSQAEAVANLIASESKIEHQIAINQMRKGIANTIKKLRKDLIYFASLIEFELNFSEEEQLNYVDYSKFYLLLNNITEYIKHMIDAIHFGNAMKTGIPIAIVGLPNAGKSTLMNSILDDDISIISDIPGTTRDAIEGTIILDGIKFRFFDTAGIRTTHNKIEKIGIKKTFEKLNIAKIILYIFDSVIFNEKNFYQDFSNLTKQYSNKIFIIIANKSDIKNIVFKNIPKEDFMNISANKKNDIDILKNKLVHLIKKEHPKILQSENIMNSRYYEALNKSYQLIFNIRQGLQKNISRDLLSIDIRECIHYLGEITGEITTNDLLDNIFSRFCIGK